VLVVSINTLNHMKGFIPDFLVLSGVDLRLL
jgi:hypothetical protein